jgi:UDP-N-acetylmuramyl pentapeptide phosphotransferase/UDP-N-acetylglucosamine-1-phosphate transferase
VIAVVVVAVSFLAGLATLAAVLGRLDSFGAAAPNDRSNHGRPTPQIGGIAIAPLWLAAMVVLSVAGPGAGVFGDPVLLIAFGLLFALGVADDRKAMGPMPKLLVQCLASVLATIALAELLRPFPIPFWLASTACALLLLTLINLTNFIDGLDLMAVATVGVPSAGFAALAAIGAVGAAYLAVGLTTAALFLAFAAYNWHPARTFLGDGGALPFGLVLGAMTVVTASEAGLLVAALLPAYILFDGCVTLARRALRGERLMQAHSTHLYQRAFRSGRPVLWVSAAAAGFGALCIALALIAAMSGSIAAQLASIAVAACLWAAAEWRAPLRR